MPTTTTKTTTTTATAQSTASPTTDKGPNIERPLLSRQNFFYKSLPTRFNRRATAAAATQNATPLGNSLRNADKIPSLHNLSGNCLVNPNAAHEQQQTQARYSFSQSKSPNVDHHNVDDDHRASTPLSNDILRLHIDDCLQELDDYLEQLDTSERTETPKCEQTECSFGENSLPVAADGIEPFSLDSNETENAWDSHTHESQMQFDAASSNNDGQTNLAAFNAADFQSTNFNEEWPSKMSVKLTPFDSVNETTRNRNESQSSTQANTSATSEMANNQTLTTEQIFNNFLLECSQDAVAGPRQLGRRATGQPTVLSARSQQQRTPQESVAALATRRPYSAPANNNHSSNQQNELQRNHNQITAATNLISEPSSLRTSHNPSPLSSVYASSSTDSSSLSTSGSHPHHVEASVTLNLSTNPTEMLSSSEQMTEAANNNGNGVENSATTTTTTATASNSTTKTHTQWPHVLSQSFALTTCTLGLFNICRFSTLVLNYGGNFVLQFLLLSFLFGIPLLWLQMCLGARIKNGPVAMWKISPICKGIGISLIIVQFVVSIYSAVCLAWLLVYLRDSLPNSNQFVTNVFRNRSNMEAAHNSSSSSSDFTHDVGQYFSVHVLQRLVGDRMSFRISERLAFYLAFLWTAVFLILCRGLRSFGKFVYVLSPVPLIMLAVIVTKLLFVIDCSKLRNIFSASYLEDFLISPHAWTAAAQETFLTWGFLGPSVIAMTSRRHAEASKTSLRSNALYVVFVTFFGLFLATLLGLCAMETLERNNFIYIPGSYETPETSKSIFYKPKLEPDMISFPPQLVPHYSSFVGETYRRTLAVAHQKSGYQALRFVSEIFPAVAVLAKNELSWGWVFACLLAFLLFGIAQLCAMWKPISSALGNSTNAVLLSCVTGLLLSIPFSTEVGIRILHYADIVLGASWIVPLLWMALIFGVFLVRGRPYNGDDLVNDLKMSTSISAFLALAWNVLLPLGLPTLAVISYKMSFSSQFFNWRNRVYFSFWERKIAGIIQVMLLLLVPIIAIVQIVRYLNRGPNDILERIQLLYRPPEESEIRRRNQSQATSSAARVARTHMPLEEDATISMPPPKYTPPPSYTTATGARMAKILRQSIRRSVRRIRAAVATNSRPWSMEPENELIVANTSNASQIVNSNLANVENAEDSFTQLVQPQSQSQAEIGRLVSSPTRSLTSSLRPRRPDRRSQSLPRSLQRSTFSNFSTATTLDGIGYLLTNASANSSARTQDDIGGGGGASRSVDNLAANAEPPDQSQPPLHIVIRTKNNQFS